jgi:hypothetical protein
VNQVFHVAWYRFRVTFAGRWSGYLSILLLIGIVGGIALGSIAATRRMSTRPTLSSQILIGTE